MDSSDEEDSGDESNRYDDAEDDVEIDYHQAAQQQQQYKQSPAVAHSPFSAQYADADEEEEEDDEEDDDDDEEEEDDEEDHAVHVEAVAAEEQPREPAAYGGESRGKPQAFAMAMAASKIDDDEEELEAERHQHGEPEGVVAETTVVEATAVVADEIMVEAQAIPEVKPKKSPKKKATKKAAATKATKTKATKKKTAAKTPPASAKENKKKRKTPTKKSSPAGGGAGAGSSKKKSTKGGGGGAGSRGGGGGGSAAGGAVLDLSTPSVDDPVDPITEAEYENLIHLMEHFCKVPLLAEFSRPVTLLHPELMAQYSKCVKHPIDLGKVCRKIGRRSYSNLREVQLDVWRIFSNCVRYHSHPSNKEGVPSFVSIALHLREYWNNLFEEFLLPSELPKEAEAAKTTGKGGKASNNKAKHLKETYATREENRKRRLIVSGLTCMSTACMKKSADKINSFLSNQGRVDRLDPWPIFPGSSPLGKDIDADDQRDLEAVVDRLGQFRLKLMQMSTDNAEYTVEQFDMELKNCYLTEDLFENNPALRFRVRNRLNRFLGKILVPINEANCRGVTQSSVWGCMAAAIWARESSKKPFWPALVLGILAPDDQKEDWHWALTERNEQRLPEALRTQLAAGKRKAEQALKRQSQGQADPQSFFLVEFLGSHEFIWVRETDIVESFEPDDDPNLKVQANKKKRGGVSRAGSAALVGSKKYQAAIEEAGWALEEFEMQLQDACGDMGEDEDGEDGNYSYSVLCVSDDEADDAYEDDNDEMTLSEVEEANELIATRGLIDFSVTGRKNAAKRKQMLKKQKMDAEKKEKLEKDKKRKAEQAKKKKKDMAAAKTKEREEKKELKELERRRKKRSRDREKALKSGRKNKKKKPEEEQQEKAKDTGKLYSDKRLRATAIVKGYLTRMASDEEYRSLGLQGIMGLPAAMVDSSGLLGMALAFRAAAGELSMPTESGERGQVKPWDAIVVDDTMTEGQRKEALMKQIRLLEGEIKKVKSATATRLKLAKEAESVRNHENENIFKEEELARVNPFKKKKKVVGSVSKSTENSPDVKNEHGGDENDGAATREDVEVENEETMIDLGETHVTDTPPRESVGAMESDYE